jgi:hypothetical protein
MQGQQSNSATSGSSNRPDDLVTAETALNSLAEAWARQWVSEDRPIARTVSAPGSRVRMRGNPKIEAFVVAVLLKAGGESYQVAWFDGNTRNLEWLEPEELLEPEEDSRALQIGFRATER